MSALLILLSVLLQAGCFGYLSGRLTPSGSLLLSGVGFAMAAAFFSCLLLVRRWRGAASRAAPRPERRRVRQLLLVVNLLTAVTFLSFYVALAWIPATLASGIETALGPLALAALQLLPGGFGARPTRRTWLHAAGLALVGGVLAWRLTDLDQVHWPVLAGVVLAVVAGAGASGLALASKALGRLGVDPVTVTAHRFHLTYLGAGVLYLLQAATPEESGVPVGLLPLIGATAVTAPLFVLQVGLQRADPRIAMTILTTLPGVTYLSEAAWGGPLDLVGLGLTVLLVVLAAVSAVPVRRAPAERRYVRGSRPADRAGSAP
ncbi:hypothetical protein AB0I82_28020 [Streptomyces sp. NPDC050315]|uniref:hypothetical protein n=1 Tax=Streptomyces sp. NPDC050315 TaxID=3155039 RepID=UPI00341F549F